MDNLPKTFNDLSLDKVCRALDFLEHDRLHEAYVTLRAVRADLLVEINKERRAAKASTKEVQP